ncbi:hypothetical protein ACFE04_022908 [Oxalis oulophora]
MTRNFLSLDLGVDALSHDEMNIDISQKVAHPSRKRRSSDPSWESKTEHSMLSIVFGVPHSRKTFRMKTLPLSAMEAIPNGDEVYFLSQLSTHDDFLEKPSLVGFTPSSSSVESISTLMSISRETPSVPSSLSLLVSPQATTAPTTMLSTLNELPSMSFSLSLLYLMLLSSPCAIVPSTMLSALSELPSMSLLLPPFATLCDVILTQATAILTQVTTLGCLVTCIHDASTTLPRALLKENLSIVIAPSIISSSRMPSPSSSNASVFSASTLSKVVSESMYVVAMTRNAHFEEVSEAA